MSTLLKYLLSAKGERSLLGKIGQWRLQISRVVDELSESLATPYIEVRRATSNQAVDFTAEDDIVLNTITVDGGISYDTTTGIFTLPEAGLYELEFFGAWTNFATPNTTIATVQWVGAADDAPLEAGLSSWSVSATSTDNSSSQPVAKVLYQASAGEQVKLKASSLGGGGTADLLRGASFATARKIG